MWGGGNCSRWWGCEEMLYRSLAGAALLRSPLLVTLWGMSHNCLVDSFERGTVWLTVILGRSKPVPWPAARTEEACERPPLPQASPFPWHCSTLPTVSLRDVPHSHASCHRLPWITTINNKHANFWSATLWTSLKSIFCCNLFHQKPVFSLHLHLLLSTNPHIMPSRAFPLHTRLSKANTYKCVSAFLVKTNKLTNKPGCQDVQMTYNVFLFKEERYKKKRHVDLSPVNFLKNIAKYM